MPQLRQSEVPRQAESVLMGIMRFPVLRRDRRTCDAQAIMQISIVKARQVPPHHALSHSTPRTKKQHAGSHSYTPSAGQSVLSNKELLLLDATVNTSGHDTGADKALSAQAIYPDAAHPGGRGMTFERARLVDSKPRRDRSRSNRRLRSAVTPACWRFHGTPPGKSTRCAGPQYGKKSARPRGACPKCPLGTAC